jgi:hypothetical protein
MRNMTLLGLSIAVSLAWASYGLAESQSTSPKGGGGKGEVSQNLKQFEKDLKQAREGPKGEAAAEKGIEDAPNAPMKGGIDNPPLGPPTQYDKPNTR